MVQRRLFAAPVLLVCLALAGCGDGAAAPGDVGDGRIDLSQYSQTFSETFDHLDVSAWGPGTRWIAHTPWAGDFGDAAFADPEPSFPFQTAAGMLRIEARKDFGMDPGGKSFGGRWRSGLISSRDKQGPKGTGFAQAFGYFEIETKLPPGPGTWPAFWLSSIDAKPNAEIDVFEYYGHEPTSYHANVHIWSDGQQTSGEGKVVPIPKGAATSGFNRYGVAIDPDWVTFYFNREPVWRTPTRPEFRRPFYILVDLALGSGWPIDRTPDPSFMYVKSIAAYRRNS